MADHTEDCYSPEAIEHWLRHWVQLEGATIGATGPNYHRSRGGRHGRETLATIKADLEEAADSLPLHWYYTARIYKLQGRWKDYLDRRAQSNIPAGTDPGLSFESCCALMSHKLGWRPSDEGKVA